MLYICMHIFFFDCGVSWDKIEAMTFFILHQSHPPCHDVDTRKELVPCTINNPEDYDSLMRPGCSNGSMNMTCLPLALSPREYFCARDSTKEQMSTSIKWSEKWQEITEPVVAMKRELCSSETGWCLDGMFKMNYVYLVKNYVLLNSQITVSSFHSASFPKENVRIADRTYHCAWAAGDGDSTPWVKFDLLQSYIGAGLLIRKRCDLTGSDLVQYVTSFDISSSNDDFMWIYIGTNIHPVYHGTYHTWWFDQEVAARFWKIEIKESNNYPSMQADIIGHNG